MALLQRVELLERQRVDRTHQPQLAVELADPPGGAGAVRKLRHRSGLGDVRLDVEFATQRLDRRLEPQLGFGLVELGLPGAFGSIPGPAPARHARDGADRGRRSAPAPRRSGDGAPRRAQRAPSRPLPGDDDNHRHDGNRWRRGVRSVSVDGGNEFRSAAPLFANAVFKAVTVFCESAIGSALFLVVRVPYIYPTFSTAGHARPDLSATGVRTRATWPAHAHLAKSKQGLEKLLNPHARVTLADTLEHLVGGTWRLTVRVAAHTAAHAAAH